MTAGVTRGWRHSRRGMGVVVSVEMTLALTPTTLQTAKELLAMSLVTQGSAFL